MKEYIGTALVGIDEVADIIHQLKTNEIIDSEIHHTLINSLTKIKTAIQFLDIFYSVYSDAIDNMALALNPNKKP